MEPMIFYFSGTGNSRWVAQQIAAHTGDSVYDITALKALPPLEGEQRVGLVFPIYAWGAPEPVRAFVRVLQPGGAFTFGVCTCGSEAGLAMKKLPLPLDSCYSLVMPNNYIIGSEPDDPDTIRRKLRTAREEIARLAGEVLAGQKVYRVTEGAKAGLKSGPVHWGFEHFARTTRPFQVTDACNGCGRCAQHCPAGTITLTAGKPIWGKQCYQCLRCINECPQQAIQYGDATQTRRRYIIDPWLKELET